MRRRVFGLVLMVVMVAMASPSVRAQGGAATGQINGAVRDDKGTAVPGATVTVSHDATGSSLVAETDKRGVFTVPYVPAGVWTVRAGATGFKTTVVTNVRPVVGTSINIPITLFPGAVTDVVTVHSTSDIAQAESPVVTATITGDEMLRLPSKLRSAIDFVQFLPGVDATLDPRAATIMGLPQSATSVTQDGINVQNNIQKTTNGLFPFISPRIAATDSLTLSLATPGASAASHGATHLQFVTRSGTSQFGGSVFYSGRATGLTSNSYFNEQFGLPANTSRLNQLGINEGGPLGGNAFFFVNYADTHEKTAVTRTRTILAPSALTGTFTYNAGAATNAVNVLALAAANGQLATTDPTIAALLANIQTSTTSTGATRANGTDPLTRLYSFQNESNNVLRMPTVRTDVNLSHNHRLTGTYTWARPTNDPDTLNGFDPAFLGFTNLANQASNRQTGQLTLRSTIRPNIVNEIRGGGTWGNVEFGGVTPAQFASQAGFALTFPLMTSPSVQTLQQSQNQKMWTIGDSVTWLWGKHTIDVGGEFSQFNDTITRQSVVPGIAIGLPGTDPSNALFTTANFPGASTTDLVNAGNLYALLTGRVSSVDTTYGFDAASGQNVSNGAVVERGRMNEGGVFVQDAWRWGRKFTLSAGLRYELQSPFVARSDGYATATLADICGVSGTGSVSGRGCNLFAPGALNGTAPQFTALAKDTALYRTDRNNVAPNIGMVWKIGPADGFFRKLFGDPELSALHAAYAVSYARNGLIDFRNALADNSNLMPVRTRDIASEEGLGLVTAPVLLRNTGQLGPCGPTTAAASTCAPAARTYPFAVNGQDINIFDPNIKVPQVKSYSFGLQRSVGKTMSVDLRYVGTRLEHGWATENWNELNPYESGFLDEFRNAQANLQSNIAVGRGATFQYFGPGTNTAPLPLYLAFFSGQPASAASDATLYTSTRWTNAAFINRLSLIDPDVVGALGDLWNNPTLRTLALGSGGLTPNRFVVNPDAGEANVTRSAFHTQYDSLQIDVRRRFSQGLQMTANYTYARRWDSILDSVHFDYYLARSTASVPHAFKTTWTWQIPFGRERSHGASVSPVVNGILGGWDFSGTGIVQSGQLVRLAGARLVGMTEQQLRDEFKIRKHSDGTVTTLPDDIILNTRRAFSVDATNIQTGYSALGVPTGRYLAPATTESCTSILPGECGEPRYLSVTGPVFSRFDINLAKQFALGGRRSLGVQVDVFNVFNTTYFTPVLEVGSSPTINQVTGPFNDVSDAGARVAQFLVRVRW